MSWHNAPPLNKLTATQLGGKLGAQLWGVDYKGTLYTTYQTTPGGEWSDWQKFGGSGKGTPTQIYELAAAQLLHGRSMLWVLDGKRQIWTRSQATAGGDWGPWQGPGWNQIPNHVLFKKVSAATLATNWGARFWAIGENGLLVSCAQMPPAGNFSPIQEWQKTPENSQWIEISACTQANGNGLLFGIDNKMQLWAMSQKSPGGEWGPWVGPNWKGAPKVRNIAAVEMAHQKGACLWAIDDEYKILCNEQPAPGTENWWGWDPGDFENKLRGYELTTALQNNTLGRVWVISLDGMLTSMGMQLSSPVDWEKYWTPPARD